MAALCEVAIESGSPKSRLVCTREGINLALSMKAKVSDQAVNGLSLLELLLVIVLIIILIGMLLPAKTGRGHARTAVCMSNQRQILMGEELWQSDNHGSWRWSRFADNPSNLVMSTDVAADYFQPLLRDSTKNSRLFVCSLDKNRSPSNDGTLRNTNVSYFVCFTAGATNPSLSVLTGDRNLAVDKQPLYAGLQLVAARRDVSYDSRLHPNSAGVLGFMDGHAESKRSTNVTLVFKRQNVLTNVLAIP